MVIRIALCFSSGNNNQQSGSASDGWAGFNTLKTVHHDLKIGESLFPRPLETDPKDHILCIIAAVSWRRELAVCSLLRMTVSNVSTVYFGYQNSQDRGLVL